MNESELAIAQLEKHKSLGMAMERLNKNEDFKAVFIDGYYGGLREDITGGFAGLTEERTARSLKDLYAISFFKQYADVVLNNGVVAVDELEQAYRDLEEE